MYPFTKKFYKIRTEDGSALLNMIICFPIVVIIVVGFLSLIPKMIYPEAEKHVLTTIQKIEPHIVKHPADAKLLDEIVSYKDLADRVNSRYVPIVLERSIVKYTELDADNYELCITVEKNNSKDLKYSTVDNKVVSDTNCNL